MKRLYKILFSFIIVFKLYPAIAEDVSVEVYKSPYCACCEQWISHLEQNGFKVTAHDQVNIQEIKSQFNISSELQSCHTAVINGYFVEGHVPAQDIKKLLTEKPDIKGLSVPGMPAGINVPGMETKAERASFDVIAVGKESTSVYARYE